MEWHLDSDRAVGRPLAARLVFAVAWATMLTACGIQADGDQFYDIEFSNDTQTAVVLWNHHIDKAERGVAGSPSGAWRLVGPCAPGGMKGTIDIATTLAQYL